MSIKIITMYVKVLVYYANLFAIYTWADFFKPTSSMCGFQSLSHSIQYFNLIIEKNQKIAF